MRILLVCPGGLKPDQRGYGGTPVLLSLVERLARRHDLHCVTLNHGADFDRWMLPGGPPVVNLGRPGTGAVQRTARRAWRLFRDLRRKRWRPQIVHSLWLDAPTALGALAAARFAVPQVASLGGQELCPRGDGTSGVLPHGRRRLVSATLSRPEFVTAGSEFALDLLRRYRTDARWLPLFPAPQADPGPRTERAAGRLRLLTVSSINRVKDAPTVLGALRILRDRGIDAGLDWVGEDVLGGAGEAAAARLGLSGAVVFHGHRHWRDLGDFYAGADVYVQGSRFESQGVAVCEAARAGLPVVGTRVGLVAELAPAAAIAVAVGDGAALADGCEALYRDPARRFELGDAARRWMDGYDDLWTATSFESLYEQALEQHAP